MVNWMKNELIIGIVHHKISTDKVAIWVSGYLLTLMKFVLGVIVTDCTDSRAYSHVQCNTVVASAFLAIFRFKRVGYGVFIFNAFSSVQLFIHSVHNSFGDGGTSCCLISGIS